MVVYENKDAGVLKRISQRRRDAKFYVFLCDSASLREINLQKIIKRQLFKLLLLKIKTLLFFQLFKKESRKDAKAQSFNFFFAPLRLCEK
jgi:hypothetical protein